MKLDEWQELIAATRVEGTLPISFALSATPYPRVVLEMPVTCVDTKQPSRLQWHHPLPEWTDRWAGERLLLEAARAFYFHELCEQFIIYGAKPFIPDHRH